MHVTSTSSTLLACPSYLPVCANEKKGTFQLGQPSSLWHNQLGLLKDVILNWDIDFTLAYCPESNFTFLSMVENTVYDRLTNGGCSLSNDISSAGLDINFLDTERTPGRSGYFIIRVFQVNSIRFLFNCRSNFSTVTWTCSYGRCVHNQQTTYIISHSLVSI